MRNTAAVRSDDFGPFGGRVWLDCAHQGPLPRAAAEAVRRAVEWKVSPYEMPDSEFADAPDRLKRASGRLINAPAEEIVLGNSTSYGIHLLANGIPWNDGDRVLLVESGFPASILPWLGLAKRGARVEFVRPPGVVAWAEEVEARLTPRTRLFCASWVNSFSGGAIDLEAIGRVCEERGVLFVVNGSQAVGARAVDVRAAPIDALVSCGFKWLCGPYGTGFCWMRPELLASLQYNQIYWLAMQRGRSLNQMREYRLRDDLGSYQYDVFCPASFLNVLPWIASLEYLLSKEIHRVEAYDQQLVSRLVQGLDPVKYRVLSPDSGPARSTLVLLTHRERSRNEELYTLLGERGIDVSLREGNLRVSPHLYNTGEEIDALLSELNSA
jgi:cysteine desulfurase/selenocysteine lyase